MCAISLQGMRTQPVEQAQTGDRNSPGAVSPNQTYQEGGKAPVQQEGIVCPECNTSNEIGWSFCQQCGSRLPASPPSQADSQPPDVLKTVVDQRAVFDPSRVPSLKTVSENPPSFDDGMKTIVSKPPVAEPKPRIEPPLEAPRPSVSAPPPVVPVQNVEPAPPPAPPPSTPAPWAAPPTVVAPIPPLPKPAAPPPRQPVERPIAATPHVNSEPTAPVAGLPAPPITATKPAVPPATRLGDQPPSRAPITGPGSTTQHVASLPGVSCSQCGQSNNVGSTFCSNCGAAMTFGQTMVMSSQPAQVAVIGRLHLVMESGQPGDVYELGDDTVIGRNTGEINFPHDGFMSGRHARIVRQGNAFRLTDEGSRNGTFIKIKGDVELKPGDMILVGKQLFRFEV
jgi:hypothetical protein